MKAITELKPGDKVSVGTDHFTVVSNLGNVLKLENVLQRELTYDEARRVGVKFFKKSVGTTVVSEIVY